MLGQPNDKLYLERGGAPARVSSMTQPATETQKKYYPVMNEALTLANKLSEKGISWIPQVADSSKALTEVGNQGARVLAGEITSNLKNEEGAGKSEGYSNGLSHSNGLSNGYSNGLSKHL